MLVCIKQICFFSHFKISKPQRFRCFCTAQPSLAQLGYKPIQHFCISPYGQVHPDFLDLQTRCSNRAGLLGQI